MINLKLGVFEFGETCHEIMDAFERGEPTVRTSLAMALVGHIHAVLKEQSETEKSLHSRYAHEGGTPQVMTIEIAREWIKAIDVPIMTDIYQTGVPNVFYATFSLPLMPEHKMQIEALGFAIIDPNSRLRNRWMMKWTPPRNDEF